MSEMSTRAQSQLSLQTFTTTVRNQQELENKLFENGHTLT